MEATTVLATVGWRLEFYLNAGRVAHVVHRLTAGRFVELIRSLEGPEQHVWPVSPPFQELHVQQPTCGVQAALLVGRAGRSHWSASIELVEAVDLVRFDVACRIHEQPAWLGSCYLLNQAWRLADRTLLLAGETMLVAELLDVEEALGPGTPAILRLAASQAAAPYPQTVRWQYSLVPLSSCHLRGAS